VCVCVCDLYGKVGVGVCRPSGFLIYLRHFSICASLNVKLCEKGTGWGMGRDEGKERERRDGRGGTSCASLNFP